MKNFSSNFKGLDELSQEVKEVDLYPLKSSLCFCKSGKKYKKCCYIEETKPFNPLDKDLKILPDTELFFIEDKLDRNKLLKYAKELNKIPIQPLTHLRNKHPDNQAICFLLAIAYKFNQDEHLFQKILEDSKNNSSFLPMKLLRWWHIFEEGMIAEASIRSEEHLQQLAPKRKSFYLTEFSIWGLIRIREALNHGRFVEAEHHFLSLIQISGKMGDRKHWSLEQAELMIEMGYFLRRQKLLEMRHLS